MSTKTDNAANVGRHKFEVAGLGLAPFTFQGMEEKVVRYPDGTTQAGGSCDYCGTGIRYCCHVESADGKRFKVGSECIAKVGDAGLLKAYKSSPQHRAHQRALREAKAKAVSQELRAFIEANAQWLRSMPHFDDFIDHNTGAPLTALDWATWMRDNCGASGRAAVLRRLKRLHKERS